MTDKTVLGKSALSGYRYLTVSAGVRELQSREREIPGSFLLQP
jgi:hypothetical protein